MGCKSLALNLAILGMAYGAFEVDLTSRESIKTAAALKAQDVMSHYHGHEYGQTPGILPGPPPSGSYYWWQAGALWGTMLDYWKYTGDASYNQVVQDSLLFQVGPDRNYMPPNVTATIGNDDQAFWGMSAMLAAETNFQNPPPAEPQWLALAQAVFNTQTATARRDDSCGGGLRWQVLAMNNGYNYKNAIANGAYFNLAARLARYTGDGGYAHEAARTFDWLQEVAFVDGAYNVYDGGHTEYGCRDINHAQFSYNVAVLLQGAAFMYGHTGGEPIWAERVDGLLDSLLRSFFPGGVAWEMACEGLANVPAGGCTNDMLSFKGFDLRWMAAVAQLCPWTRRRIMPALRASAAAAVKQCTGGFNGRTCGMRWSTGRYDGSAGLGQEMNALAALMVLLIEDPGDNDTTVRIDENFVPLTHDTGGTSTGDPNAGGSTKTRHRNLRAITMVDMGGAACLTALMATGLMVVLVWMCGEWCEKPALVKSLEAVDIQGLDDGEEGRSSRSRPGWRARRGQAS